MIVAHERRFSKYFERQLGVDAVAASATSILAGRRLRRTPALQWWAVLSCRTGGRAYLDRGGGSLRLCADADHCRQICIEGSERPLCSRNAVPDDQLAAQST